MEMDTEIPGCDFAIGNSSADSSSDDVRNKIKPNSRVFHTVPHTIELCTLRIRRFPMFIFPSSTLYGRSDINVGEVVCSNRSSRSESWKRDLLLRAFQITARRL
jgi:hypothetical protein